MKTITIADRSFTGITVKDARSKADAFCAGLIERTNYGPDVITCRGWTAVISGDAQGWKYLVLPPEPSNVQHCYTTYMSPDLARADAVSAAMYHLAQCFWTWHSDDIADDDAYIASIVQLSDDSADILRTWCKWQRAYIAARADGKSDAQSREIAHAA